MNNSIYEFRAWDKEKKIMRYEQMWWNDSWIEFISERDNPYPIQRFIVMLCTGFKDRNKKKIYENDIVRYSDKYTAVVVWKDTGFGLEFLEEVESPQTWYYLPNSNVLEILGNIYENPELIVLLSDDA